MEIAFARILNKMVSSNVQAINVRNLLVNSEEWVKSVEPTKEQVRQNFSAFVDYLDSQVTRHGGTTFNLVSKSRSAVFISCAVASDVDKTKSLPLVQQDVEDGLSVKDSDGVKVRVVCLEGMHELLELSVVLRDSSSHLCCNRRALLEEEGCTVGRGDCEEQERTSTL